MHKKALLLLIMIIQPVFCSNKNFQGDYRPIYYNLVLLENKKNCWFFGTKCTEKTISEERAARTKTELEILSDKQGIAPNNAKINERIVTNKEEKKAFFIVNFTQTKRSESFPQSIHSTNTADPFYIDIVIPCDKQRPCDPSALKTLVENLFGNTFQEYQQSLNNIDIVSKANSPEVVIEKLNYWLQGAQGNWSFASAAWAYFKRPVRWLVKWTSILGAAVGAGYLIKSKNLKPSDISLERLKEFNWKSIFSKKAYPYLSPS
jgi:hypothetical protein